MKRMIALILTAALSLTLASCKNSLAKSEYSSETSAEDVVMQTQFPVYSKDIEKFQVTITNNTGAMLEFGTEWTLEVLDGDEWMKIPFVENVGFNSLLHMLSDGGTHTFTVSRNMLDYELTDGKYRVVKKLGDKLATAEFVIGASKVSADSPYGYLPLERLPDGYSHADAIADGCVAIGSVSDSDAALLDRFFADVKNGASSQIRLCEQTDKGLVLTDILYEKITGDRIGHATDRTRAGGKIEATYYGAFVTDGDELYLSDLCSYHENAVSLMPILENTDWSGKASVIGFVSASSDFAESTYAQKASFWSADGMRNIQLDADKPLDFGVTRIYQDGGNSGSMNSLPANIGMKSITDALWQSDCSTVMFICKTDDPEMTGYVFYDTDDYKMISYTASQHGYTVNDDGTVSIPE